MGNRSLKWYGFVLQSNTALENKHLLFVCSMCYVTSCKFNLSFGKKVLPISCRERKRSTWTLWTRKATTALIQSGTFLLISFRFVVPPPLKEMLQHHKTPQSFYRPKIYTAEGYQQRLLSLEVLIN